MHPTIISLTNTSLTSKYVSFQATSTSLTEISQNYKVLGTFSLPCSIQVSHPGTLLLQSITEGLTDTHYSKVQIFPTF